MELENGPPPPLTQTSTLKNYDPRLGAPNRGTGGPALEPYETDRAGFLSDDVLRAFGCPISWTDQYGFEADQVGAYDTLHAEWVRCVAEHSITFVEPAMAALIYDWTSLSDADAKELPQLLSNMSSRREPSVAEYMNGIGRLAKLKFLRPSHDGKHYDTRSVMRREKLAASQFYVNLQAETIAHIFWTWFGDIFALDQMRIDEARHTPLVFLHRTDELWRRFLEDPQVRVGVDMMAPVGFQAGAVLTHIAIDVHLAAGTAHAYPIQRREAVAIMGTHPLRQVAAREDTEL